MNQPNISLVIPAYNEAGSLPELEAWIDRVLQKANLSYELIFIDDGSQKDNTWEVIEKLSNDNPNVKGIRFRRNYGKSAGLSVGFEAAVGAVVFTMDADLQDSPDELPEMYRMIVEEDYDLVSGWKKERHDSFIKNNTSKIYNYFTRKMSGIPLNGFNCGLKAYKNIVIKSIDVYGERHRYLPVLAKHAGFGKITEKAVKHQARLYGESKFGAARFIRGPLDLLSVMFVGRFGKRPMHLFGMWGGLLFTLGFFAAAFIGLQKLYRLNMDLPTILVTDNPFFYISLICMVLGTQLFLAGFLAELMVQNSSNRKNYNVAKYLRIK